MIGRSRFRSFLGSRSANVALILGIISPVLLGLVAGAVDLLVYSNHKSALQAAADNAALAAASEAGLKGWSAQSARTTAEAAIGANLAKKFSTGTFEHEVVIDKATRSVRVELTQDRYGYFFLGYFTGSPQIRVDATARAAGQATLCVIVTSGSGKEVFKIGEGAKLHADGCSAYSNSGDASGLSAKLLSRLVTQMTCTAGGYKGVLASFSPVPLTDCPAITDPLAARGTLIDQAIEGGGCTASKLKIDGKTMTLSPGVYCGGIRISKKAHVTLSPGVYVIRDGSLKVDKESTIEGQGVGLAFTGDKAKLELKNDSSVSLSAPGDGAMSGILVYGQPAKKARDFRIESRDAQELLGTVYLPADKLTVGGDDNGDGLCDILPLGDDDDDDDDDEDDDSGELLNCESDVGTASDWTAIIASRLNITTGVQLVLNSDYEGSPVPVPAGIGPNSQKLVLVE